MIFLPTKFPDSLIRLGAVLGENPIRVIDETTRIQSFQNSRRIYKNAVTKSGDSESHPLNVAIDRSDNLPSY